MNDETQKFDDSPQARFVKNQLRKEFPDKTDEEIEAMWQERLRRVIEQEGGQDDCYVCGS
jgi:hypothetical protein